MKRLLLAALGIAGLVSLSAVADSYSVRLTPNHVNGRYEPNQVVGFTLESREDTPIAQGQKFRVTWYAGSEKRDEKIYTYDSADPKLRSGSHLRAVHQHAALDGRACVDVTACADDAEIRDGSAVFNACVG